MSEESFGVKVGVGIVKGIVTVYDIVSLPIYYLCQRPWVARRLNKETRAVRMKPDDPYSPYVRIGDPPSHPILECETVPQLFKKAVEVYGNRKCLGQREVFGEEEELQEDGKMFQKLLVGEYKWLSYIELDKRIDIIAKGLMSVGVKEKDTVMMLADTRLEWYLTAQAVFRIGSCIATLYTTLGLDGIIHGLNETKVTHMVTTVDFLPKLKQIISKTKALKTVIYIEGLKAADTEGFKIQLIPFSQMEEKGKSAGNIKFGQPKPTDAAVIMYTSGSTGIPKGVIIVHKNLIGTIRGFWVIANTLAELHVYIAFLPLAHVLELAAESFFMAIGVPIGYSSPNTMTDKSTAIKKGAKGDAALLRPTVMAAVPLVLDRIRKAVATLMESKGAFVRSLFYFLLDYKTFWRRRGYNTPIVNFLICRKVQELFGGRLQYVVTGSAPLSPDTHEFIRSCLNVTLIQGYGLTETAAGAALMDFEDLSVGRVGPPLYGLKIRLEDWPEGNYSVNNKPYPRGEIVIGGDCVTAGYYKNEKLTNESFKNVDGERWFWTGDIAEVHADGVIKIIDRRKDLVKLQFGEYISLGKVEADLKSSELVDNVCVYADSKQAYVVALVVPNPKALTDLGKQIGKGNLSFEQLCDDPKVNEATLKVITEHGKKTKLHKSEIPVKITLIKELWTPESGLVTAAFKLKRKNIEEKYKSVIERMYGKDNK